jgi:hypothetical protein
MRAGVACTFRRYEDGEDPRGFPGRQEEGPGGKPGTGPCFSGAGGVPGFPPVIENNIPLLQFVRSGVGVILTSPSLLVEGVRSGSRRRNAATPSPLARGGAEPESRPAAPAWAVTALCSQYVEDAGDMRGSRAEPGISPASRNGLLARPQYLFDEAHSSHSK